MILMALFVAVSAPVIVSGGSDIDYQPSPLQDPDGRLVVAFERLTPPSQGFEGDIWITFSSDTGQTWATPMPAVTSNFNLRHPSLVHVPSGGYRVFYLSDQSGGYRIFSAFSPDGIVWSQEGEVNLGWSSGSYGNPTVTAEGDSALVMSYDHFFGQGGYVSRSTDGGVTWDTQRRRINLKGRLNRIILHPDGTYLCSWQETGGGTVVNIFASYSTDLSSWADSDSLTTNNNGHDSMPFVDGDLAAWVYYAKYTGGSYRIMRRRSPQWGTYDIEELIYSSSHNATQPHPLLLSDGRVALFWGEWWNDYNQSDVMMEIFDFTGMEEQQNEHDSFGLMMFPNPFSSSVTIEWSGPAVGNVTMDVYDVHGRLVETVNDVSVGSGGSCTWNPDSGLPSGIYTVRLMSGGLQACGSCMILR